MNYNDDDPEAEDLRKEYEFEKRMEQVGDLITPTGPKSPERDDDYLDYLYGIMHQADRIKRMKEGKE